MKAGEYGWIQEHMEGVYLNPTIVKILSTDCPGIHNIKVATEFGQILYCTKTQIKSRPGKVMKIEPAIPEEVKAKALRLGDNRHRTDLYYLSQVRKQLLKMADRLEREIIRISAMEGES